jgi:hypothetical protein
MLVLSLFPGIGILDMVFDEEGFCVVRGPESVIGKCAICGNQIKAKARVE